MSILFYVGAILTANYLSSSFAPVNIGPFAISPGTITIAASFVLRDLVQNRIGRRKTYGLIMVALIMSAITAHLLGDTLAIVQASALAFAVSETADTEIYTWLKLPMSLRVWWSGLASGVLDSVIFVVVGLGPWGAGFLPWTVIPMAVLGQVIAKTLMCAVGALGITLWFTNQKRRRSIGATTA